MGRTTPQCHWKEQFMSAFDRLYSFLPIWTQNAAVSTYGLFWWNLRFGHGYSKFLQEYLEREYYSLDQWQAWQKEQLNKILPMCANHVRYYRDNWSESQRNSAINGEINSLPLLEKNSLRENPKAFLQEKIHPIRPQVFPTSGTTGTPISSYYTIPELRQSMALREARSARWAGVSFNIPRATLSGRMVVPQPDSKGPFHRYNAIEKQVYFSAFHIRPDTAQQYVDALLTHDIKWGTGYAVSFSLLAKFILEKGIQAPNLKAIITTSERLTPEMRTVIEEAFGCNVYEEYSTVENALFASECEHGRLHVSPDVALVEILRPDGSACLSDESGEVVVTTLTRTFQPLVRFRLGDIAMWDTDPCLCGRMMPVIKEVVGRIEDIVIGPDGRQMVRFHGIFTDQPHVFEGQIIQEDLAHIKVKIVPTRGFDLDDVQNIKRRVQQRLGHGVHVLVETVDKIPRTKAGKFQAVVSDIKKE